MNEGGLFVVLMGLLFASLSLPMLTHFLLEWRTAGTGRKGVAAMR